MNPQIPTSVKTSKFILIDDLDLAACCLADDCVPRLPPSQVSIFIGENNHHFYSFRFAPTQRLSEIVNLWNICKSHRPGSAGKDMVGYIFSAFRYFNGSVN